MFLDIRISTDNQCKSNHQLMENQPPPQPTPTPRRLATPPDIHGLSRDIFECKNAAMDLYGEKFKPVTELNEMLRVSHTDETLPLSEPNYQHLGEKEKIAEIRRSPVEVGNLSHYYPLFIQGFIHPNPRWLVGFLPSTVCPI